MPSAGSGGLVNVNMVGDIQITLVEGTVRSMVATLRAVRCDGCRPKLEPCTVMTAPPVMGPDAGEKLVITGGGYARVTEEGVPAGEDPSALAQEILYE
jgi:hypothetical protein